MKSVESSPAIAPFYVWEPPDRSIRVLLRLSLIEAFNSWLEESSDAGEEVGGILLGSVEHREDAGPVVRIENFEPIRIEHRRGPTYTLTEKEKDRFGGEITGAERRTRLTAVGLVRSHIRRGLYLDIADAALFRRYVPNPAGVFLLLSAGPEPVGGFFWDAGDLQKQAPYARFPLDRQRLERISEPLVTNARKETPRPAPVRRALPLQTTKRERRAPRRFELVRWSALLGVAAAVFLTIALWHESRATPPPKPARIGLGLNVARQGDHLRLTWDPRSPLVVQASAGTLWIDDGIQHTRRDLNRAALLKGAAAYEPISADVNFALEVRDRSLSSRESIRSIQNDMAVASATPPAAAPLIETPAFEQPVESAVSIPAPAAVPVEARAPERTLRRVARRVFAPPPAEPEHAAILPSNNVALAAPPAAIALAPPVVPPVSTGIRAAPLPPPPPVLDIVGYQALPEAKFRLGIRAAGDFVSPRTLREVRPELPRFVAETLSGDHRIELRAEVDPTGTVTDVEPLTRGANPWLTGAANTALRRWRFEPALAKGRPVASRVVVTFRFNGSDAAAPSSQ